MIALLPALILGCFKPHDQLATIDTEIVPFENPYARSDDAVVQRIDTLLECPDGQPAPLFVVYREGTSAGAPVAIVLHSGAFDFVMERTGEGPLDGPHYHANSRLDPTFATAKVWETLGMQITDLDPAEDNKGTLPATLVDRNFVQLHPGNCWGDLWHNEEGVPLHYNDIEADGFARNGRTFAWWMVRVATDETFADSLEIDLPVKVDPAELYLFGLGEGGRGVVELLSHEDMPPVRGALLDSSPDDLSVFTRDPETFEDEIEGLQRIFTPEGLADVSQSSLAAIFDTVPMPERMVYLWSDGDTRLPSDAVKATADLLEGDPNIWVRNTHEMGHVISNSDLKRAREAVDFLTTGSVPAGL